MAVERLKVAVVGCGAMVEQQHLPSLMRIDDCQVTTLVERNLTRADTLADKFNIPQTVDDYRQLIGADIDAVVIGLPNHLHAPVSIDLLKTGKHVLVEKPISLTVAECDAMIEAAKEGGATLAVGHIRRFSQAGRFAKWAIESGLLGKINSFDIRNGFVYNWGVTTDFFLRKELAGGGVFMDLGVHTLDQMLWWLGDVQTFRYADDSYGGVEADCELHITLASGAEGFVELSRTRDLSDTAIIRGEKAELEVGLVSNTVSLRFAGEDMGIIGNALIGQEPVLEEQRVANLITAEHIDFFKSIRGGSTPAVCGVEARRSLALIEACYAARQPLHFPWVDVSQPDVSQPDMPRPEREAA